MAEVYLDKYNNKLTPFDGIRKKMIVKPSPAKERMAFTILRPYEFSKFVNDAIPENVSYVGRHVCSGMAECCKITSAHQ
jgi:hypothetical protein